MELEGRETPLYLPNISENNWTTYELDSGFHLSQNDWAK